MSARDRLAECINFTAELQNTPVSKLRDRLSRASAGLLVAVLTDTIRDIARCQERIDKARSARDRSAYHVEKLEEMVTRTAAQRHLSQQKDGSALDEE